MLKKSNGFLNICIIKLSKTHYFSYAFSQKVQKHITFLNHFRKKLKNTLLFLKSRVSFFFLLPLSYFVKEF